MSELVCGACGTMAQSWQSFCTECGVSIIEHKPRLYDKEKDGDISDYYIKDNSGQVAATLSLLRMAGGVHL